MPAAKPGAAPVAQLLRRSLHDDIADLLRDRIVEGKMPPGSFVDEAELVQSLGVSRTPIREALKVLAFEGLVTIFPNRGSYVARLAPEDARALIEVLAELEGFSAYLACQRLTEADLIVLRRLHEDMVAAFKKKNKLEYFNLNQNIHLKMVACARNEYLRETHRGYTSRLRRVRYLGTPTPEQWRGSVQEHEEILRALEARDADKARARVTSHVAGIWPQVEAVLLRESEAGDAVATPETAG
ncbi:GntR family transcriptional regulator [Rhodoligotrophos defluvii]|uniref:GntR family transcriptional regulator n=1 Tax=Rhodoligotrophos defluvii TaxID=2561934 RepID=UPI00148518F1|nr:GntR family transcriptional regulator [Rhodoligotrophos defluvii]